MKKEVVDMGHPYWEDLYYRLIDAIDSEGCGGNSITTEMILLSFPNIDVYGTLELFKEMGGFCDCEILDIFYSTNDKFY